MANNRNRGLGSLYLILAIHVVLIVALSPITNSIPPVFEDFEFANVFAFEVAPNQFARCDVRSFLFYFDESGNKRGADFDFQNVGLFTTFDIQSRATGATVEDFEIQTSLKCSETLGVENLDLVPTSSIIYDIFATDKDGKEVFVKTITIDPTRAEVGTRQFSTMRDVDVLNTEVVISTVRINADEIEDKIAPVDSAGRRGTTETTQQFNTFVRVKTNYNFDFDIQNVKWEGFGIVENGYKMRFVNTDFSGTINRPTSTDIIIQVERPHNGIFSPTGTRTLEVLATLPEYQSGEGLPTMTVTSEQTGITVGNAIMNLASQSTSESKFRAQIVLPSVEEGKFKVSVSLPKRTTAVTLVSTSTAGSTQGMDGMNPVCTVDPTFINQIDPTVCTTNTCEDNNQVTSSFLGFGMFCSPPEYAFIFQGFNILIIFAILIVVAIFIKIGTSIASGGGSKVVVRSAVPTGF